MSGAVGALFCQTPSEIPVNLWAFSLICDHCLAPEKGLVYVSSAMLSDLTFLAILFNLIFFYFIVLSKYTGSTAELEEIIPALCW